LPWIENSGLGLSADLIDQPTILPKLSDANNRLPSLITSVIPEFRFLSNNLLTRLMLFPLDGTSNNKTDPAEVP
jgi:hypothetical protein